MRRFWSDMNPTLRGFIIIALIAGAIYALSLEAALVSIAMLLRIAFFIAIAVVVYFVWRDRVREDASTWSRRAQLAFYGAFFLIIAAIAVFFWRGAAGLDALALVLVIAFCAFAMWRVWRDEHTFGY
jgi:hypothetical protein